MVHISSIDFNIDWIISYKVLVCSISSFPVFVYWLPYLVSSVVPFNSTTDKWLCYSSFQNIFALFLHWQFYILELFYQVLKIFYWDFNWNCIQFGENWYLCNIKSLHLRLGIKSLHLRKLFIFYVQVVLSVSVFGSETPNMLILELHICFIHYFSPDTSIFLSILLCSVRLLKCVFYLLIKSSAVAVLFFHDS